MRKHTFSAIIATALLPSIIAYTLAPRVLSVDETSPEAPSTVSLSKPEEPSAPLIPISPIYYDCPLDNKVQDYIRTMCEVKNLPMSLVLAVISVESSFRPWVISSSNDYGLMQINVINHGRFSEEYGITDFLNPCLNAFCGITLLAEHYNRYQDESKALMAYNLGTAGAKRLWGSGIYETSYTRKVISIKEEFDNEIQPSGR